MFAHIPMYTTYHTHLHAHRHRNTVSYQWEMVLPVILQDIVGKVPEVHGEENNGGIRREVREGGGGEVREGEVREGGGRRGEGGRREEGSEEGREG